MTDHAKRQEYLAQYSDIPKWTKYACMSFGVIVVMGNLIFMVIG